MFVQRGQRRLYFIYTHTPSASPPTMRHHDFFNTRKHSRRMLRNVKRADGSRQPCCPTDRRSRPDLRKSFALGVASHTADYLPISLGLLGVGAFLGMQVAGKGQEFHLRGGGLRRRRRSVGTILVVRGGGSEDSANLLDGERKRM